MRRDNALSELLTSEKALHALQYPLLPRPWRGELKAIAQLLNGPLPQAPFRTWEPGRGYAVLHFDRAQAELRRLVEPWKASGPNMAKLLESDEALEQRMQGRTVLLPTKTGRAFLSWEPHPAPAQSDETGKFVPAAFPTKDSSEQPDLVSLPDRDRSEEFALYHFMSLVVNPEWELLLGNACMRCGRYILKNSRRPRLYCSRSCGAAITAVEATRKRRQADYDKNISKAETARNQWQEKKRRSGDWKKWVSSQTNLTLKWLTRAINKGNLLPPTPSPGDPKPKN